MQDVRPASPASVSEFAQKWYVVQRAVIDGGDLRSIHDHALARADSGSTSLGDHQVPDAPVVYADPSLDMLLESVRPKVEVATGRRLWPTYSYLRVYKRGNLLAAHLDRPSCEISMTVNLGMDADEPWPIGSRQW